MSNIMRTLLQQAEKTQPLAEPPAEFGKPLEEDETVVGTVPHDIRQVITLAHQIAQRLVTLAGDYDAAHDPENKFLGEIYRLRSTIAMLEACAEESIVVVFVEQVGCMGTLWIRAGWRVAWSPTEFDDEDEEECEEDEHEVGPKLHKPTLN